jgi:hypothetical protein
MTELLAPLSAQEIEAEIPQASLAGAEELQRKARFFAALPQKMRPKTKYQSKDCLPAAYAKRRFRTKGRS